MAEEKKEKKKQPIHEVVFYTYPKLVFTWPLIAMGFLLWPLAAMGADSPGMLEVLAWIWGATVLLVVITMGVDMNRNYTIFWMVIVVAIWLLVVVMNLKGFTFFQKIYHFFADLNPKYSANLGLIVSIPLLIGFIIMWFWTRVNSKWRITHNEFEHYQLGRLDDSIARGAKRLRSSYPDLFELLICLAGDLVIYDASGRREIRRIPHVLLLPFVKKRINILLEKTAVTQDIIEDELEQEASDDEQGDLDEGQPRD
ncbi:MAG: hypothetical protein JXA82_02800 [Sedimentisphaerales bacterium]|nr:hypothetical protein [Sedimentisphaerales bacterium]